MGKKINIKEMIKSENISRKVNRNLLPNDAESIEETKSNLLLT